MRISDVERRCLQVEGTEFMIETRGSGSDCFVLVPGIGMSPRYFVPLARELAATATVHAMHLPGFGAARRPVQALPIRETGRLAAQALRQLHGGRFIVVGHSMGCLTGVEMALADPAAVRSLVLLGPSINSRERTLRMQRRRLIQDTLWEPPQVAWTAAGDYLRCGRRWYYANAAYMIDYRLEERLPLVHAPIVLVRGEHDPIAPRSWLAELAAAGTAAVMTEIPGEAHAVMYRSPVAVARHCLDLAARS
ncbi:alpha/beta fold hydrolase [Citricoccus sp.]|uniref:alpha/beta fold hydrolase n=1 Tax=Citricoccus sp. TaxID=1978372 RepID=UPI0026329EE1|nr:alpha/beta hydrolase [Citricoccus sp.]HRO29796.1 alpha/beta hydrolase [Citricoccus sp.]HRO94132.1 alpha/beta hydrolase [Citricoccus sp.]